MSSCTAPSRRSMAGDTARTRPRADAVPGTSATRRASSMLERFDGHGHCTSRRARARRAHIDQAVSVEQGGRHGVLEGAVVGPHHLLRLARRK